MERLERKTVEGALQTLLDAEHRKANPTSSAALAAVAAGWLSESGLVMDDATRARLRQGLEIYEREKTCFDPGVLGSSAMFCF